MRSCDEPMFVENMESGRMNNENASDIFNR